MNRLHIKTPSFLSKVVRKSDGMCMNDGCDKEWKLGDHVWKTNGHGGRTGSYFCDECGALMEDAVERCERLQGYGA